jgi:hypothetical protein
MASTELKRKAARNKSRVIVKANAIKKLTTAPVIKKITPEEVKAQFTK